MSGSGKTIVHEGVLEQKGRIGWKKYQCVLDGFSFAMIPVGGSRLSMTNPVTMHTNEIQSVRGLPQKSGSTKQTFLLEIVKTDNKTITLAASSEQDRKRWLHHFTKILKAYKEVSSFDFSGRHSLPAPLPQTKAPGKGVPPRESYDYVEIKARTASSYKDNEFMYSEVKEAADEDIAKELEYMEASEVTSLAENSKQQAQKSLKSQEYQEIERDAATSPKKRAAPLSPPCHPPPPPPGRPLQPPPPPPPTSRPPPPNDPRPPPRETLPSEELYATANEPETRTAARKNDSSSPRTPSGNKPPPKPSKPSTPKPILAVKPSKLSSSAGSATSPVSPTTRLGNTSPRAPNENASMSPRSPKETAAPASPRSPVVNAPVSPRSPGAKSSASPRAPTGMSATSPKAPTDNAKINPRIPSASIATKNEHPPLPSPSHPKEDKCDFTTYDTTNMSKEKQNINQQQPASDDQYAGIRRNSTKNRMLQSQLSINTNSSSSSVPSSSSGFSSTSFSSSYNSPRESPPSPSSEEDAQRAEELVQALAITFPPIPALPFTSKSVDTSSVELLRGMLVGCNAARRPLSIKLGKGGEGITQMKLHLRQISEVMEEDMLEEEEEEEMEEEENEDVFTAL